MWVRKRYVLVKKDFKDWTVVKEGTVSLCSTYDHDAAWKGDRVCGDENYRTVDE